MKDKAKGKIGQRVKTARKHRKRSQQWLADEVSVRQSSVSEWEREANNPNTNNLISISKCLGVSYQWLATGDGPMEVSVYEPITVHIAEPIHQTEDDLARQELLELFDALPRSRRSVLLEFMRGWVKSK